MKKFIIVLVFLALVSPIFAQSNSEDRLYYINVTVERIFPSMEGYVIQYRSGSNVIATIGIPIEWFSDAGGRADLIKLSAASDWPTMSIFYVNGQFSHVRLYVHPVKSHHTWGSIPQGTDVARFFGDRESFALQF